MPPAYYRAVKRLAVIIALAVALGLLLVWFVRHFAGRR